MGGWVRVMGGMKEAFKEWAVVVDALESGGQIIILRKGGIAEGRGGFQLEHERFWLFPTRFHQQKDQVVASAMKRYQEIEPGFPPDDKVRLSSWCEVVAWKNITSGEEAGKLEGQHIWTQEVIKDRFDWGRRKDIYAIAVRTYRLQEPTILSMSPGYGGCKSWIDLEEDLTSQPSDPVLSEQEFQRKLEAFESSLGGNVSHIGAQQAE